MRKTVLEKEYTQEILALTEDDLPYDDGIPMDNERQIKQIQLLTGTLSPFLKDRDAYITGMISLKVSFKVLL